MCSKQENDGIFKHWPVATVTWMTFVFMMFGTLSEGAV